MDQSQMWMGLHNKPHTSLHQKPSWSGQLPNRCNVKLQNLSQYHQQRKNWIDPPKTKNQPNLPEKIRKSPHYHQHGRPNTQHTHHYQTHQTFHDGGSIKISKATEPSLAVRGPYRLNGLILSRRQPLKPLSLSIKNIKIGGGSLDGPNNCQIPSIWRPQRFVPSGHNWTLSILNRVQFILPIKEISYLIKYKNGFQLSTLID